MKLRKPASRVFASAVAILVLGGAQAAMAQGMPPMPCEQWTTPVGLPPGATIGFIDVKRVGEKLQGYAYLGDRIVPGTFVRTGANPNMVVAIWDIPLAGAKGYLTFTAAREADLLFQSADPRDPTAPIRVKTGFTQFKRGPYRQLCGTSNTGKFVSAGAEAEPGLHDDDEAGDPAAGRGWSARTEELDESEPKRLVPRVIRPAPAKPVPSLESLLPKAGAKAIPEKAPPKTPIAELMPATKPPVAAAKPAVVDADRGMRVCLPPALKPVAWPWNIESRTFRPEKPIIVGKRNATTAARLYEYIDVSSSYIPKGEIALKKAPSFLTAIEFAGRAKTEVIDGAQVQIVPVTIPGIDLSAAVEVPKTGVPLKIMVVGAPEEISISGLERIGKELEKDAKLDIKLEIEWHEVTATGDIMPPVSLEGLPALVRAAREKAKKDFFITPDEKQFSDFIKKFTSVMTSRSQPVDRVIWVKGAYKLPNTAPVLVQGFLDAVAASRAVPRTPSGDIERWLYVVTARMPGFSVNYVKEPVTASNAGAVFMEPETGGPTRRLLDGADAATFVRNMSGAAMVRARSGPAAVKPAVSKVVLNANELLAERGYLLSPVTLQQLAEKLRQLSGAWDADGRLTATAAEVVKAAGKASSDSIADVVEPILPMLNPFAGGVVSTSIMSHNPADQKAAADFVKALAKLSDEMAKELNAEGDGGVKIRNCDFVYMSSNRITAAAADAKAPEAPAGVPEEVLAEEPATEPAAAPETPAATAPPPPDTAPDTPADAGPAVAGPKAADEPPPTVPLPDPREGLVPGDMRGNEEMPPPAAADPALKGPAP